MPDELHRINLIDLVVEACSNSANDYEFARRIALACVALSERMSDRESTHLAIRAAFQFEG